MNIMKDIEKLKEEQQELKERLKRLIDFMNSEEFFSLPEGEKSLLSSQRIGMEMYLNALTNRIYANVNAPGFSNPSMLSLMLGMISLSPTIFSPSTTERELQRMLENDATSQDDESRH